jgi:hypothetical protein
LAALAGTMHVAMRVELGDRPAHVPATHDVQVVHAVSAHGADAPLGVGVCPRSLDRGLPSVSEFVHQFSVLIPIHLDG